MRNPGEVVYCLGHGERVTLDAKGLCPVCRPMCKPPRTRAVRVDGRWVEIEPDGR